MKVPGGLSGVVAVLGLLLFGSGALWYLIAQPVRARSAGRRSGAGRDRQRLEARVRRIVAFPERSFGYPERLDAVAEYLRGEPVESGARVGEQTYRVGNDTYRNVIARFGPEAGARIVVGAHYDSADEGPGADDNASGVAGLLALADLLAGATLQHRVDLVAYGLEEPPAFATDSMGSLAHARALRASGVELIGMLGLEMIGYFDTRQGSQSYPLPLLGWLYPAQGDFIGVVGRFGDVGLLRRVKRAMVEATDLPVVSLSGPAAIPGVSLSDHRSYWACGYSAVMVTDSAFYRNPHYHSRGDRPETLDYERMAEVVVGVHAAVLALDAAAPR